jgi:hypothetical protein
MAKTTAIIPKHYEIEAFRRSVNRKLWFALSSLFVVSVLSVGLALLSVAKPIPVVVFDSGRPVLFEDTATPRRVLDEMRIEVFVEDFLELFVGIDSVSMADNLHGALELMTPEFRAVILADKEELARRKAYKGQNLRSRFSDLKIRIGDYDPQDANQDIYVLVSGKMVFEPRLGELDGQGEVSRHFLSQLALRRVATTKLTIHGLQVDYCHTRTFETAKDLDRHLLTKAARP